MSRSCRSWRLASHALRHLDGLEHRARLFEGLLDFWLWLAVRDHATSCLHVGGTFGNHDCPQRDRHVEVAAKANVAERSGVDASLFRLELGDYLHGADLRSARHRSRGKGSAKRIERGLSIAKLSAHRR